MKVLYTPIFATINPSTLLARKSSAATVFSIPERCLDELQTILRAIKKLFLLAFAERALLVRHHGAWEYGSPKLSQPVEALILHALDDLDGKFRQCRTCRQKSRVRNGPFSIAPTAGASTAAATTLMRMNEVSG